MILHLALFNSKDFNIIFKEELKHPENPLNDDIIEFKKENLTMAMYMADYGMMIPLKEWHHDP